MPTESLATGALVMLVEVFCGPRAKQFRGNTGPCMHACKTSDWLCSMGYVYWQVGSQLLLAGVADFTASRSAGKTHADDEAALTEPALANLLRGKQVGLSQQCAFSTAVYVLPPWLEGTQITCTQRPVGANESIGTLHV